MPWLAGLHTPAGDRCYFREHVFQRCEVWGALDNTGLIGIIAFREDWIDHLYVLPSAKGHGVGTALLDTAKSAPFLRCTSGHSSETLRRVASTRLEVSC